MTPEKIARHLTPAQRETLTAHVQGPQLIVRQGHTGRHSLLRAGLLYTVHANRGPYRSAVPRFTALTPRGRAVLGWLLAEAMMLLTEAGHVGNERERRRDLMPAFNAALTKLRYRRDPDRSHDDDGENRA